MRQAPLVTSFIILAAVAASGRGQALRVGPELRVAQFATGGVSDVRPIAGVIPAPSGFTAFLRNGRDLRAIPLDDHGRPALDQERSIFTLPEGSSGSAITAVQGGALLAFTTNGGVRSIHLGNDNHQPVEIDQNASLGPLRCNDDRCLVAAKGAGGFSTTILDAGDGSHRMRLRFDGEIAALGADADGFLIGAWSHTKRTARFTRVLNDGTVTFEREFELHNSPTHLAFDGHRYVAVWSYFVTTYLLPIDLDGTIGTSQLVATNNGFPRDVSWDGARYTLVYHAIERHSLIGGPDPYDLRIEIVQVGRDLDLAGSTHNTYRVPRSHSGTWLAFNGRSTVMVWQWRQDRGALNVAAELAGGSVTTPHPLNRGDLAQIRPLAVAMRSRSAAVWVEADLGSEAAYLMKYADVSSGRAGEPSLIAASPAPYIHGAAAVDDDFLLLWQDYSGGLPPGYVSIVRANGDLKTVRLPHGNYDRVTAGENDWILFESSPNAPRILKISADGTVGEPQSLVIAGNALLDVLGHRDGGLVYATQLYYASPACQPITCVGTQMHFSTTAGTTVSTQEFRSASRLARLGDVYAIVVEESDRYVLRRFNADGMHLSSSALRFPLSPGSIFHLAAIGSFWVISRQPNTAQVYEQSGGFLEELPFFLGSASVSPSGLGLLVETRFTFDSTGVRREAVFARGIDARLIERRRVVRR